MKASPPPRGRRFAGKAAAFLALVLLGFASCATTGGPAGVRGGSSRLTLLHVNDTHSHLFPFSTDGSPPRGGFARLKTAVERVRSEGGETLFLHGGDAFVGSADTYLKGGRPDYKRIPSYGYHGLLDIEALNLLGVTAMTVGNHELDYGLHWLKDVSRRANFPFLSANLVKRELPPVEDGQGSPVFKPYIVVRSGGLRVAVVGLTTSAYIQSVQVSVEDPAAVMRKLLPEISAEADLVVVLSHLGLDEDLRLAEAVEGIDVVIGGHSHTQMAAPKEVNGTLIVQAGRYGTRLGVLDLEIEGGTVKGHRWRPVEIDASVPPDPGAEALLAKALEIGRIASGKLETGNAKQTALGLLTCAALLEEEEADAALVPSGMLKGPLGPGPVGVKNFFDAYWPHRSRGRGPEKDLSERQLALLADPAGGVDPLTRQLVASSDGLAALVTAVVSKEDFSRLAVENERRVGTVDYLQLRLRADLPAGSVSPLPSPAAGDALKVVLPIGLALKARDFGLPLPLGEVTYLGIEVFEAVMKYFRDPSFAERERLLFPAAPK